MTRPPVLGTYEEGYFDEREDPRRQAMRLQEYARLMRRTGLREGTVVDIGCGLGEFLELFPPERWQRFGTEVSQHAIEICRAKGIEFTLPSGAGWADLVVLRGSLQHLDRPLELLADAMTWLRPGGWLVALATPNAGGPVYRLWQDLPPLVPERNFVVFSDKILRQCLLNLGFDSVDFEYPYLGTPYASPVRDHVRFLARFVGVQRPFAFWRNMMECYARR